VRHAQGPTLLARLPHLWIERPARAAPRSVKVHEHEAVARISLCVSAPRVRGRTHKGQRRTAVRSCCSHDRGHAHMRSSRLLSRGCWCTTSSGRLRGSALLTTQSKPRPANHPLSSAHQLVHELLH
jgi:hypothetical protein